MENQNSETLIPISINDLRAVMMDTIRAVRDGSINIEQAKAVADIGRVMVDTAKVEVDFLRIVTNPENRNNEGTGFIPSQKKLVK